MSEDEFDERIKSIQASLNTVFDHPVIQASSLFRGELLKVAANITQIELGIKKYSRPKTWDLIQEGIKN